MDLCAVPRIMAMVPVTVCKTMTVDVPAAIMPPTAVSFINTIRQYRGCRSEQNGRNGDRL